MTPNIAVGLLFSSLVLAQGNFKDPNLEAAAKKFLPSPNNGIEDLQIITSADPIADLSGLEKCKKLRYLFVTGAISDVSPLKGLTDLETVTIKNGKIRDVAPLAGLTKLEYLDLTGNQIADLTPVSNLEKLKTLYLSNNQIKDLTPLSKLSSLEALHVDGNQITDLKPLAGLMSLVTLDARRNQIADITPAAALPAWQHLYLDQNKIADLTPLLNAVREGAKTPSGFGTARIVTLGGDPLGAEAKTKQVPELKKLLFDLVADK